MKLSWAIVFILLVSKNAFAETLTSFYNTPSVRIGYYGTIGNVKPTLKNGTQLALGFTPKQGFEKLNQWIAGTKITFIDQLKFKLELNTFRFTGEQYGRKTSFTSPSLQLNYSREIMKGEVFVNAGYGLGLITVKKNNISTKNEITSLVLINSGYEKSFKHGIFGAGLEAGSIQDQHLSIGFVGGFLKYAYSF